MKEKEIFNLKEETFKDEQSKKRDKFEYSSDIVAANCIVPNSIWVEPNSNIRKVINEEIDYGSLPYEEQNEVEKGMLFKDQAEFVEKHKNQTLLCEALENKPCLLIKCSIFIPPKATGQTDNTPSYKQPLCREFKIIFRKEKQLPIH
ncbi:hypothetical protein MUP35_03640 [Patescibacteria group bacterium]|nr:hypothetical protein [Patescibacteria group bacterium]